MSYPILKLGQDHPFFRGVGQGINLFNEGVEAMYKPQTLSEKLKKNRLYNKYYGEDIESQIGERNSNAKLRDQMAQWFGPTAQSNIDQIYQATIPTALSNNLHTNAQTAGLDFTNKLNNDWQTLEDKRNSIINNAKADVNNMIPSNQVTDNKYNPYTESYNPTTVENIPATGPIAPLNNADNQAIQQNKIQQQAFDYLTRNNIEANGANIDKAMKIVASQQLPPDTYAQAQQNNAPMQSANPASVTEYIKNLGGITGQQGGMSLAPQQQQLFIPSSQNLSSLRQGNQQVAQMPSQMPAKFDSNASLNQINQQQAAITARLNKNKPVVETPEEKEEREVRTDARKEKGREDLAAKKVNMAEYKKIGEETKTIADAARATKKHLADFVSAYRKAPQLVKGPLGGMLPKGTDKNAQEMDRASAEMMVTSSKAAFGNRMALAEFKHMGDVKPNRQMSEETINRIASYVPLAADRAMEQQEFMNKCKENGISATAASVAWGKYDNEKPIYDFTTDKPIEKNIGKWREYLPSKEEENSANSANSGMVTVRAPNGQLGNIPSDKVEAFLSAHPGSVRQ